jgi:hypothetical protein
MAQLLLTAYLVEARLNRAKRSRSMKPIVCAVCSEVLTSALWDKETEHCTAAGACRPASPTETADGRIEYPCIGLNFPASSK